MDILLLLFGCVSLLFFILLCPQLVEGACPSISLCICPSVRLSKEIKLGFLNVKDG